MAALGDRLECRPALEMPSASYTRELEGQFGYQQKA